MQNNNTVKIGKKSSDEFYTPLPPNYILGKTKYVFVAGSFMSGVGKGIVASSIGKLLIDLGLKVAPIKMEGYLNIDSGTLNPYRHGEVFVLDDGTESDMDLGSYERYLDLNLTKNSFVTAGIIFSNILKKERKGSYLGRDIQFIPHVTGEIKYLLRNLAVETKADVIVCEMGGTVGEYENSYILEAFRQLMYEEKRENVCFIDVTYILEPNHLGEQKSKPAQFGFNRLMGLGIQPNMILCRSENIVEEKIREKISVFSNVSLENVLGMENKESIYQVPIQLHDLKIDKKIVKILNLENKINKEEQNESIEKWKIFNNKYTNSKKVLKVGIAGKYTGLKDSYASIIKALEHAGTNNECKIELKFIETTDIEEGKITIKEALKNINGLIVPGGFGSRGIEGKIACVKYIRENNIPYLGICLGFQIALIEFARNVCKLKDANTTEVNNCQNPVIIILPGQEELTTKGANMRLGGKNVKIIPNTKAYSLYNNEKIIRERFRHRYECNPEYIKTFEDNGIIFSGKSSKEDNIMQILELNSNDFFMGCQFHPEFTSRPLKPNPMFAGFINAILKQNK